MQEMEGISLFRLAGISLHKILLIHIHIHIQFKEIQEMQEILSSKPQMEIFKMILYQ